MDESSSINIIPITIEDEMKGSYMDYAMSVIIGRALPDVRDGLKPVHRRILYAMLQEGLTSKKRFSKCAGVVGEVLKHYHPHGDMPVYQALVRMAQPWNQRYLLIDGQGNFGSVDGDAPAAYRYTECRMTALAETLLLDIEKDTVDFIPNFDESVMEPVVLPSRVPNLLINGSEGIAVGMASSIPPHNLNEIVEATIRLIKEPEIDVDELMECVPGPDFPTGGIIYGAAPLKKIYSTGRGLIKIRSQVHFETFGSGAKEHDGIIVDELPFQVNKARLIEKIGELVKDKRIEGIAKLRDESDRKGMRVVVELKRDAVADVVLNQLYKLTSLQKTYGVTLLAIVDGAPRVLSLKEALTEFIRHRREVITRRCRFELGKARARLHILEGLRIALDNIEEIIALIRASESTAVAKEELIRRFALSEVQAQQILDMPLRRLTGLERKAIEDEYNQLKLKIEELLKILADRKEVDKIAIQELEEVSEAHSDERRTVIEADGDDIELEDLIAEEDMVVTISHKGYVKRCSPSLYRAQKRGGKGVQATKKLEEEDTDFVSKLFVASTHAYLLIVTNIGKLHWLKVYNVPESGRTARGRAIVNLIEFDEGETVSAIVPVREFEEGKYLIFATKKGIVKRVDLMAFSNVRKGGIRAVTLDEEDEIIEMKLTDGETDCLVNSRSGLAIRFDENDLRPMGRTARGVRGISLGDDDEVVSLKTTPKQDEEAGEGLYLLTACEKGYGKKTIVDEYRCQNRGGKGVIDIKTVERNGLVVGATIVSDGDEVMLITTGGKVIRVAASGISTVGRNTMGVRLVGLDEGERVTAISYLAEQQEEAEKQED